MLFKCSAGAYVNYSSIGDVLMIMNKGDTDASIYLALTGGENTMLIDSENGAVIETKIYGISEEKFSNEYSFRLVGVVNKNEDW